MRELFGDWVEWLQLRREPFVVDRFKDPAESRDFMKANHPLIVKLCGDLAAEPARAAALDRELPEMASRWMGNGNEGHDAEYP